MIKTRMNVVKVKKKKPQVFTYLVVGGLTTVVSYVVFALCNLFNQSTLVSQICSFIVAVVFAYITDKTFVFENKNWAIKNVLNEFSTFLFARIFSFFVETIFLLVAVEIFNVNSLLSKFIVTIFVMIFNYVVSKKYIFKKK